MNNEHHYPFLNISGWTLLGDIFKDKWNIQCAITLDQPKGRLYVWLANSSPYQYS